MTFLCFLAKSWQPEDGVSAQPVGSVFIHTVIPSEPVGLPSKILLKPIDVRHLRSLSS